MNFWYRSHKTWLAYWLWPLAQCFCWIVGMRRRLYRMGWLKQQRFSVPIIVVGNVSVGGTGKTPLVLNLIEYFKHRGWQVGVVSRGYGGQCRQVPHRVNPQVDSAQEVGDEPYLIAEKTQVKVVIDPNRPRAVRALLAAQPDCQVILADDGLQHYALGRNLEIAVIDASRGFGNGLCLPAGPLREPIERLNDCQLLVLNQAKTDEPGSHDLLADCEQLPGLAAAHAMTLKPLCFRRVNDWQVCLSIDSFLASYPHVQAIAGIGHPQRFFASLQSLGFSIASKAFSDHHCYTKADLAALSGDVIVMTEKDAIKCRSWADSRCWFLAVEAQLPPSFYQAIQEYLNHE